MILYIDDKEAAIPEGDSFTYFEESSLFSDASGYSLDITLPLRGCAQNRAIFGYIERNPPKSARWPATLLLGSKRKEGTVVLVDVTLDAVKVQFLADRATDAASDTLEEKYIDKLQLPTNYVEGGNDDGAFATFNPTNFMQDLDYQLSSAFTSKFPNSSTGGDKRIIVRIPGIVIPWINTEEGSVQNAMLNRVYKYTEEVKRCGLSWMPYLLPLAKEIAKAIGYTPDFSEWEATNLKNLVVCNAVPVDRTSGWEYNFARALPHWSVAEFFTSLAPILSGKFEIDRLRKTITFKDSEKQMRERAVVVLDEVDDYHEINSSFGLEETDGSYVRTKPYRYADPGHEMWKFMDCPWYIEKLHGRRIKTYPNLNAALGAMNEVKTRKDQHQYLYYAMAENVYLCFYNFVTVTGTPGEYIVQTSIQPRVVNIFGPKEYGMKDDIEYEELKCLPVITPSTSVELTPEGAYDMLAAIRDGHTYEADNGIIEDTLETVDSETREQILDDTYQTLPVDEIENGDMEDEGAFYDNLFLGYWTGWKASDPFNFCPAGYGFRLYDFSVQKREPFSMRLNDGNWEPYKNLPKIDESTKFIYTFYSNHIPDVNAEFSIRGKRYLCKKIEATLNHLGMSRCMRGEFYPIVE